ncbi:MAG: hypothetical protein HOV68_28230, partial [Streptomycetaceae bacterium]|nr:hypothetical protein [Streptomycetaceae bacterium]
MSTASTPAPTVTGKKDLPLGTSPEHERLHRRIQRICWVLLIGLVVEG